MLVWPGSRIGSIRDFLMLAWPGSRNGSGRKLMEIANGQIRKGSGQRSIKHAMIEGQALLRQKGGELCRASENSCLRGEGLAGTESLFPILKMKSG